MCDPADDPPGAMAVQPPPVRGKEDRTISAFIGGQVDRSGGAGCQRDGDDLAALAGDGKGPVPAFQAQLLDVGAGGLRYPQPVQREQGDQRMLGRRAEPGSDQHGAELVAVQSGAVRFVVQPRPADVGGRGVLEELFLDRVLVEPGNGAQPPGDGGASAAPGFQVAAKLSMSARRTANRFRELFPPQPQDRADLCLFLAFQKVRGKLTRKRIELLSDLWAHLRIPADMTTEQATAWL
jgi:hypothetical protein